MQVDTNLSTIISQSSSTGNLSISKINTKENAMQGASGGVGGASSSQSSADELQKRLDKLKEQLAKIEAQISKMQSNDNPYAKEMTNSLNAERASIMAQIQTILAQMLKAAKQQSA
ncbi:hypothetical protein CIG1485E_0689 [Campylobacter iguaniorum]|uniref:FlxA-like protein n=1 Tax=Campylobacter iguaniorum TaxID=1244531 RepID=A0A076FFB2_9BACT|nr:hypothetical protein [Campylobacter iguaniorum]AII14544.1 hypothetical protein CIG1485E_0689 [Campylobacter iguaniorum]